MIIRDRFISEDNNMISDTTHGFRNKRLCLTNLLHIFQGVYKRDDHVPSGVMCLGFPKASTRCRMSDSFRNCTLRALETV